MEETIQASEAFLGDVTSDKETRCNTAIALLNLLQEQAYLFLRAIHRTTLQQAEEPLSVSGPFSAREAVAYLCRLNEAWRQPVEEFIRSTADAVEL